MSKNEPLVDVANNNKIFTDSCPIIDVNLQTITIPELDFTSAYRLKATKTMHLNHLVVWFDTFFSHGQKTIRLTTSRLPPDRRPLLPAYPLETGPLLHP